MTLNPFIWTGAIGDGVPREDFARHTALTLKGGTHMALFGPRGIGKTSFLLELTRHLSEAQDDDAPPWELLVVDLRRAISLPAFIGALSDALAAHPNRQVRRAAKSAISKMEKELGINLAVFKLGVRSAPGIAVADAEALHSQLVALTEIADRLVIAFDEFQRLASCPGEPLSLIRSALMGPSQTGRLSLLLTGSLRERLRLMLHTSEEPIWDQTHDVTMPDLGIQEFADYLELKFAASDRPIDERAVEHLIALTGGHPKRTQHVAWHVWEAARKNGTITAADVQAAFDNLISSGTDNTDFARTIDTLLSGPDADVNEARALFLLAAGGRVGSDSSARLYGLTNSDATRRALERLRARGLVLRRGRTWEIVDPLLAAWLRSQNPVLSLPDP